MPDDSDEIGDELAQLGALLATSEDLQGALHRVAVLAERSVPRCSGAGVMVGDPGGARTVAATSDGVWAVGTYQYGEGEGPGVEALRYAEPRRIDDVNEEDRWRGFCAEAGSHGLLSALALPLRMAGSTAGALTFYGERTGVFDGISHDLAVVFASRSALALSNADLYYSSQRMVKNLHAALKSRAVIEQAKGMLMAREHCDAEAAFEILRNVSQNSHERVASVAARLVQTLSEPDA